MTLRRSNLLLNTVNDLTSFVRGVGTLYRATMGFVEMADFLHSLNQQRQASRAQVAPKQEQPQIPKPEEEASPRTEYEYTGSVDRYQALKFCAALGVSIKDSWETIKKRYWELTKACHPDTHPNDQDAADRFKIINEAYAGLEKFLKGR